MAGVTADGGLLPGLPGLFDRLGGNPWSVWGFVQRHPELDGTTAAAALKAGKVDKMLAAALSVNGRWAGGNIRTGLANKTISRVFICFHEGTLYALHGFIEKTQKTPAAELAIARKRKHEVEHGREAKSQ